jgi:hypothetical protein
MSNRVRGRTRKRLLTPMHAPRYFLSASNFSATLTFDPINVTCWWVRSVCLLVPVGRQTSPTRIRHHNQHTQTRDAIQKANKIYSWVPLKRTYRPTKTGQQDILLVYNIAYASWCAEKLTKVLQHIVLNIQFTTRRATLVKSELQYAVNLELCILLCSVYNTFTGLFF